ncbi:hypothetical protein T265_10657 [Opisthorchis viverrini]|uniref:Ig-like domain-containing protein n=1 Tax=Opisthorchis viverrini TaxID=6198 RepID=A0A074Z1M8_OPIVI|nr:hypothetical protein T265_10657 [Opisthorchis viverrini]KER20888.1 hypothetical protein T265_10657 [Opisthorchis viverrini]
MFAQFQYSTQHIHCGTYYLFLSLFPGGAETHVPIVANHNNQIRLNIGDHLRLECPVHSTSSGSLTDFGESGTNTIQHDEASGVLYHWRVRDRLDYTLDSDPRYRFSQNRRVLEVTVPLEVADSGTYTCTGVTGFGKREVTFEVHVRDPDSNLLCAPTPRTHQNVKAPCFLDPLLKQNPVITVEQPVGSTVKLNCEADGTEPIRYRWFMGNTVADWITTSQGARGPILTIDHVGREHTGHYTCQVSNIGGSLNYTYRLVVTDPGFLKGRRVLFYFLIPFGLLFIILGLVAYVFFCRRKGSTRNSLSSSNERCILRTTDLSSQAYHVMLNGKKTSSLQTSSRHSSNSQVTGRQPYALLGIQSPLLQSEIRPAAATNGIGQHNSLSEASTRPAYYAVGAPQGQTTVTPLIGMPNTTNQNSNSDFNNAGNNAYFPVSHTSTQRNLPYPPTVPVTMFGGMVEQQQFFMTPSGPVASNSSGYEGSNGQFHHFQPVPSFSSSSSNQRMNVPIAPSIATEISFDQYSAVSQGQLSSGTLTNHYTAPFNDYSRGHGPEMTDNTGNMQHNFPRA